MRFVMLICFLGLSLGFSVICAAQDNKAETGSSQTAPKEETTKSDKSSQEAETADEPFDIDGFFKQGEENAKKGSSCQKAPDPIA